MGQCNSFLNTFANACENKVLSQFMFFNSHLYQRNLAVVGAQKRISQVVVVVGFFFLLDMSRSPDLLEPHSGSCRGKGLLTRAYHGYVKEDDESAWVERQCELLQFRMHHMCSMDPGLHPSNPSKGGATSQSATTFQTTSCKTKFGLQWRL